MTLNGLDQAAPGFCTGSQVKVLCNSLHWGPAVLQPLCPSARDEVLQFGLGAGHGMVVEGGLAATRPLDPIRAFVVVGEVSLALHVILPAVFASNAPIPIAQAAV